ncbi:class I SAM-dependent methyltransferase [Microbacterium aquilitoris]|uniref:Class I SAM-dependent methyltransferase n=1 Tax=Microbacterium aquilitoris TaxID=3067307 RepID=A0ABU3GH21_9MICO|nr:MULTISPECIES: class I SAM-dependent methyltransferase [unclassified Microbacterium]MDT3329655.1 class I SAM-dependent methyltransferase [Microbacterium sp. KSW-18]MDT3345491.1 class I SAM-dependent methyltransferase [Microbacterium sp. KSW2-22]
MTRTTAAYSRRATEYADALGSVSAMHHADRDLIETWGAAASGRLIDAGCGPGHWTQHLAERGSDIRGIDLVPEFIDHARAAHPGIRFDVESIESIDEADAALGGILAWFSTIHHEPSTIAVPLAEFARVLRPGGSLLLGCFDADETEAFDHAVLRAFRWNADDLQRILESAGFDVVAVHRRAERGARPVAAIVAERRR